MSFLFPSASPNTGRLLWDESQKGAEAQPQFPMGALRSEIPALPLYKAWLGIPRAMEPHISWDPLLTQDRHLSLDTHLSCDPISPRTHISLKIHTLSGNNTLPRPLTSPGTHAPSRTQTSAGPTLHLGGQRVKMKGCYSRKMPAWHARTCLMGQIPPAPQTGDVSFILLFQPWFEAVFHQLLQPYQHGTSDCPLRR